MLRKPVRFSGKVSSLLCAAAFSCFLSACSSVPDAAPTPYQAASGGKGYGFSPVQLSDTEYRVMFRATEATDAAMVQEYTLYRAAEIAQKNNYDWLTLVKTDVERKNTLGKRIVKADNAKQVQPAVMQEEQCTMSGCNEVAQPFPGQSGMTTEQEVMQDVYYSIVVRFSTVSPQDMKRSFEVTDLLARKPE